MTKKLDAWWNAERVGRVEEGTSQDMCPTNGDAVMMAVVMSAPMWIITLLAITAHFVFGVSWNHLL